MTELGKAYVQIVPTAKGIASAVNKEIGGDIESAGQTAGNNFMTKFAAMAKSAFIAAGVTKFISQSLAAGADLQQSFGGLETLYGDAADQAKEYAQAAAAAGISANTYAEQAVSFGAALKQAFGGDAVAAAEAANTAIMDMADNSAKFGTDIESVQAAYQGFARQQYQLLDNLKLGYGGTKEEMQRLLSDAQAITGVEYNIDNLGDVYEAIHVIQTELGVAGVAADEAKTTFTGSMNAMKAAAENLMANLSLGEDITQPLQLLTESVGNFLFTNLLPMVGNILAQVPSLIAGAFSSVSTYADSILDAGINLVVDLVSGIVTAVPQIIAAANEIVFSLWQTIINTDWLAVGTEIMNAFNTGVATDIPQIVSTASQMIAELIADIASHLPEFLSKGFEIIGQLVAGLISAIPDIVGAIPSIVSAAAEGFTSFDWLSIGSDIVSGIVQGITSMGSAIGEALMSLAKSAWSGIKSFFGIESPSKLMRDTIGQYIPLGLAEGIEDTSKYVTKAMDDLAADAMQVNITPTTAGTVGQTVGNVSVAVNVYGNVEDYDALANRIADTINAQVLSKVGVIA